MSATADRATVIQQLREVFDRVTDGRIDAAQITEQAHIFNDLGLKSLELLELRFEMETVWHIKLADGEAQQLGTVKDVVDLIVARAE
jgi:acyl carrier protein